jgi:hypothetical protein
MLLAFTDMKILSKLLDQGAKVHEVSNTSKII